MVDDRRSRLATAVLTAAMIASAVAVGAQQSQLPVSRDDVRELTASLEELADMLRASLDERERYRKLELAIAYLQFRSRRIEGLERELRGIEDSRASIQEALERQRQQLEELDARVGLDSGQDADRVAMMTNRLRIVIESQESQLDRLDRTALDLENDIAEGRRRLQQFEDYVLENLDLEE